MLTFRGRGALGKLGLTELFFETVEPENADTPIKKMLAKLPEGRYRIAGPAQENGKRRGRTAGNAWLTHDIPQGPPLVSPAEGATVPIAGRRSRLGARFRDNHRQAGRIIAYQLIIEKDVEPHPHMIGKFGLSIYLPPTVTSIDVPDGFSNPAPPTTGRCWRSSAVAIRRSHRRRSRPGRA